MRHNLIVVALLIAGCGTEQPADADFGLAPADLLGSSRDTETGFSRALPGEPLRFPADHGAHPDYRAEWWYFTGHLATGDSRQFGFQLTFFRYALRAGEPPTGSPWRSPQVAMAHFALTDEAANRYIADEQLGRTGAGLAGAQAAPFRVWQGNWSAHSTASDLWPMTLVAGNEDAAIELTLEAGKPRILQGNEGLSQKGHAAGNASWYYSYTRLPASGHITTDGKRMAVSGTAWLDREWSTSSLDEHVEGWDWFAFQLDDGRDLMFYRLRDSAGQASTLSGGILVASDGSTRPLAHDDVQLEALARWESAQTGAIYPVTWRLKVPTYKLDLTFTPAVRQQEQGQSVHYWEGAGKITGSENGRPLTGRGYVELTGYARQ